MTFQRINRRPTFYTQDFSKEHLKQFIFSHLGEVSRNWAHTEENTKRFDEILQYISKLNSNTSQLHTSTFTFCVMQSVIGAKERFLKRSDAEKPSNDPFQIDKICSPILEKMKEEKPMTRSPPRRRAVSSGLETQLPAIQE